MPPVLVTFNVAAISTRGIVSPRLGCRNGELCLVGRAPLGGCVRSIRRLGEG